MHGGNSPHRRRHSSVLSATKATGKPCADESPHALSITTDCTTTSLFGLSCRLRGTLTIFSTASCPSITSPKMVCLPLIHWVGAFVIKYCKPVVLWPAWAFDIHL